MSIATLIASITSNASRITSIVPRIASIASPPHAYFELWSHAYSAWPLRSVMSHPSRRHQNTVHFEDVYTVRGRSFLLLRRQNPDENIEYWPRPTNKILSAGPCIGYGRFPTLFSRFFCSIEMSREPRRSAISQSFEIVLTSQTIISKRAT